MGRSGRVWFGLDGFESITMNQYSPQGKYRAARAAKIVFNKVSFKKLGFHLPGLLGNPGELAAKPVVEG